MGTVIRILLIEDLCVRKAMPRVVDSPVTGNVVDKNVLTDYIVLQPSTIQCESKLLHILPKFTIPNLSFQNLLRYFIMKTYYCTFIKIYINITMSTFAMLNILCYLISDTMTHPFFVKKITGN